MRTPFERLVYEVEEAFDRADPGTTLGQLAEKFGEDVGRIMDALDCARMLRGERTYL